jgi:hypothetical protein
LFEGATGIGVSEFVDWPDALAADVFALADGRATCDAAGFATADEAPLTPASEGSSGPPNAAVG